MLYKIKGRLAASLCYLAIIALLALAVWFRRSSRPFVATPTASIDQILQEMQVRKIEAQYNGIAPQTGTCTICFEQAPYWLPCGHYFHLDCIKQWLKTTMSCPNCRRHPLEEKA